MARFKKFVAMMFFVVLLVVGVPTNLIKAATPMTPIVVTTLRGGDLEASFKLDWFPMMKNLATGTVPGDKYSWAFEASPLYAEGEGYFETISALNKGAKFDLETTLALCQRAKEVQIGFFHIDKLDVKTEIRQLPNGNYKAAVVGFGVKGWQTPYGAETSKELAFSYLKKCKTTINMVVKKLKKARYKNKILSTKLVFKWVHDWLIASADYDFSTLEKAEKSSEYHINRAGHLYNEYGPIVDGKTVCQGYSFAFKAICDEYSKQTGRKLVVDVAHSEDHAWNRVKIDNKWYIIDLTVDDWGSKEDFCGVGVDTQDFMIPETLHEYGANYATFSGCKDRATSAKYVDKNWPVFAKDLKECTVTLKYPSKVYAYRGKQVIPEVVVRYGKNVIPKKAYRVVRTDHKKTGWATFKVVPSKNCNKLLKGSLKGPTFKIRKAKAKKIKK